MGSCLCRETQQVAVFPDHLSESESVRSLGSPIVVRCEPACIMIEECIRRLVELIGTVSHGFDNHPASLINLHMIADNDVGWQRVVVALVNRIPLDKPLGSLAISIIFVDSPLPSVDIVLDTLQTFGLSRMRALSCHISNENKRQERNKLVILGCMAEKFDGTFSERLLTQDTMEYLYTFLTDDRMPELLLHAVITLEKFAKLKENKTALVAFFALKEAQNPLILLERYYNSPDRYWQQVGFCARWLLDNMFLEEGRPLSYTNEDMSATRAILHHHDNTGSVKISSDGLLARCDSQTLESVRSTFEINRACWYYEAEILTPGIMQIGWATKDAKFRNHDGFGIRDDSFSLAYDGCRRLIWYKSMPEVCQDVNPWLPGDILGCLIDVSLQEAVFSLNGVRLPVCKDIFRNTRVSNMLIPNWSEGFYATASFMSFQAVLFNFGSRDFRFAPTDRDYLVFNDHGTLTEEEKQRAQALENELDQAVNTENLCAICYDKKPEIIFKPCNHTSFCSGCADRVISCPLCRIPIDMLSKQRL